MIERTSFAVWLFAAGGTAIVVSSISRRESFRNVALALASIFVSLAILESFCYFVAKSKIIVVNTTPRTWRHDVAGLGAFPIPNTTTQFREFLDGLLITDVKYTVDSVGLRKIPDATAAPPHKAVFFGCSFMFGHGVDDDETLPYYFDEQSRGSFAAYNLSGEGWGPHQMLREIETGFVRRTIGIPELAVYEAIPDHLRRVSGRAPWETGPKYELCAESGVCYAGPFHSASYERMRALFYRTWTGRFLESYLAAPSKPSDIPLFIGVMERTRALLNRDGTRFVVVLWDQNPLAAQLMRALGAHHFEVIAVSSIFPGRDLQSAPLVQSDRHPTPASNRAIATYIWEHVGAEIAARLSAERRRDLVGN
jgi:hypothetical protein